MNRRELLVAGMGIGGVALSASASLACCGDPAQAKDPKPVARTKEGAPAKKTGDDEEKTSTYCPMYPYMFCGSYTVYYALLNETCSMPASMSGPNGMGLGCSNNPSCMVTKENTLRIGTKAVATPHLVSGPLDKLGMRRVPNKQVMLASGASIVGPALGYLVTFKDNAGADRYARVFRISIDQDFIDAEMLLELGIKQDTINKIVSRSFYVGHEDRYDTPGDPTPIAAKGKNVGPHSYVVTVTIDQDEIDFMVVMKR